MINLEKVKNFWSACCTEMLLREELAIDFIYAGLFQGFSISILRMIIYTNFQWDFEYLLDLVALSIT